MIARIPMNRTNLATLYIQCNIQSFYMSVLNELYRLSHFHGNFIDNNWAICYDNYGYVIIRSAFTFHISP